MLGTHVFDAPVGAEARGIGVAGLLDCGIEPAQSRLGDLQRPLKSRIARLNILAGLERADRYFQRNSPIVLAEPPWGLYPAP